MHRELLYSSTLSDLSDQALTAPRLQETENPTGGTWSFDNVLAALFQVVVIASGALWNCLHGFLRTLADSSIAAANTWTDSTCQVKFLRCSSTVLEL